jgi:hypothetical protein
MAQNDEVMSAVDYTCGMALLRGVTRRGRTSHIASFTGGKSYNNIKSSQRAYF